MEIIVLISNLSDLFGPHSFNGSAGQSFACFLTPGMNIRLIGEANDYVGKVCCSGFASCIY